MALFVSQDKSDHLVPLAAQSVTILNDLRPLTGNGKYVFPGRDPKKADEGAAVNARSRMAMIRKPKLPATAFRAMARRSCTKIGNEAGVIELSLLIGGRCAGHRYNRTKFLKERRA